MRALLTIVLCAAPVFGGTLFSGPGWNDSVLDDALVPMRDPAMVWTGSEALLWGGELGYRYDPATGVWSLIDATSGPTTFAPAFAWGGGELFVWGGRQSSGADAASDLGRAYDPTADSWRSIAGGGDPPPRFDASAVWTGSGLIVWGGMRDGVVHGGGSLYDPVFQDWDPVTDSGAPEPRSRHSAIWFGGAMVVWGGEGALDPGLVSGAAYLPDSDSWVPIPDAPAGQGRAGHQAFWTGNAMLVFGGDAGTGLIFDPFAESWSLMATHGQPPADEHTRSVWTGSELIVWGGAPGTGGRYDPASDSWSPISEVGAPVDRTDFAAVWTGTEMMVWGGGVGTGALYDPVTDSWTPTEPAPVANAMRNHTAVWTGSEMLVWGGSFGTSTPDGYRYDPLADQLTPIASIGAPSSRAFHVAEWTGSEMLVWGGQSTAASSIRYDDGGRYDPSSDSWSPISTVGAPLARTHTRGVWTGSELVVWGGWIGTARTVTDTGGRYDPVTDSWTSMSLVGAPAARRDHAMVWTGSHVLVWGGRDDDQLLTFSDGALYDPLSDSWQPIADATTVGLNGSFLCGFVWSGSELLTYGGLGGAGTETLSEGGRYDPATDSWTRMIFLDEPSARRNPTLVWTGDELIVYGGQSGDFSETLDYLGDGALYDPVANRWRPLPVDPVSGPRSLHTAVWDGDRMIVWGGRSDGGDHPLGAVLGFVVFDTDEDGVSDGDDNCIDVANPDQQDGDGDGVGDVCDNCPVTPNPSQTNQDGDSVGSACDVCPFDFDPPQLDSDGDGFGDACDSCDGVGTADTDFDALCDGEDNCPFVFNQFQLDEDGDGAGDACDCQPGVQGSAVSVVTGLMLSKSGAATAVLSWSSSSGANGYWLIGGDLDQVDGYGSCEADLPELPREWSDPTGLLPSEGLFYLLSAQSEVCPPSGLGEDGQGQSRPERSCP